MRQALQSELRSLRWALFQNGRSARTARQFIDHLTTELTQRMGA